MSRRHPPIGIAPHEDLRAQTVRLRNRTAQVAGVFPTASRQIRRPGDDLGIEELMVLVPTCQQDLVAVIISNGKILPSDTRLVAGHDEAGFMSYVMPRTGGYCTRRNPAGRAISWNCVGHVTILGRSRFTAKRVLTLKRIHEPCSHALEAAIRF